MMCYRISLLRKVKQHIRDGGVIAYPTESCFGLGCDPLNYRAVKRLIKLKNRNQDKGLIVIGHTFNQLEKLIQPLVKSDRDELQKYWPGPFSIILPVQANRVHGLVKGKHQSLAVRITKHRLADGLCNYLNSPLVSTSANKSRIRPAQTYRECLRKFSSKVMVLPGSTLFAKSPSTIIDWRTKKILR